MKYLLHCTLAAALLICSAQAQNSVPGLLSYQGQVLDNAGAAVGTGTPVNRTVTFRVWNHASNVLDANLLYSEQQTVTIANGDFSVLVGQGPATTGTPLGFSETPKGPPALSIANVFTGSADYYLGVTVDDGTAAVDNEITPRQKIVTAAFAFRSKTADTVTATSGSTSNFTGATVTGGTFNGGTFATGTFSGTGTGLTSLNATSVASGTLADARLSPNVALLDRTQTFTGAANVFQNVGIGTNPGTFKLNVNGTINAAAAGGNVLTLTANAGARNAIYSTANSALGVYNAHFIQNGAGNGVYSHVNSAATDRFPLVAVGTVGGLFVRADGHVGIGTASPGFALDVSRSTGAGSDTAGVRIATTVAGDTLGPSLRLTHNGTGGRNYGIYSLASHRPENTGEPPLSRRRLSH